MNTKLHFFTRILMGMISLALGAVFTLPLWKIQLEAPQYPEGLSMGIWINRLSGDLNTINGLNHYIGMQEIHAASFAELRLMPYMVGFFIVLGLLTVLLNRRFLLTLWFGLLGGAGAVGIWDFWRWTYDYGHNLNPHAAIKVPGMSYQPPVFGSKTLLNFKAHSFPDPGGWILIGAGLIVFALVVFEWLRKNPQAPHKISAKVLQTVLSFGMVLGLMACSPKTEPLLYTQDSCHYCRMTLMDPKYGAELLTQKGKAFKYDSVECLAHHLQAEPGLKAEIHSLWVIDSEQPGNFLAAEKASYLHSFKLPSPMGGFMTPTRSTETAQLLQKSFPGEVLTWEQALKALNQTAKTGNASHSPEMLSDLEKAKLEANHGDS
ncbi:hypothetical protein COW36_19135 [bacterium (Candidatus Blackallbacteria) CG17_big_fil_post_rev_8_21_14_2_50_48_46]|uniref:Copper chaperone NosL n=1 Tax=bacterium (Candidatus Blackallbacteria) CG17_big_fil_post_rev_8_21_14_2_50_48_46 TaxID=2014261 RepID=A0A2M7G049_9BACT|nr:MAG: hypothetical protein COW64_25335 [bacterium (Candidatus Blackallbacteria) CG18_big_fil_WC_8_21_14_2_50_49_26]PIW15039.1 MAG: hypothetical protein COW36_19135 [bacterium (Candidatus Blackallbacteria) CG17_big_fil_post_rev_8_21_14_2_50_48_46]PIW47638.1 MAG: hypothetical protein COW20_12185 [bacterium (Candidatus Blackallbacteria) CG13_big_fil_rev_8_21_14_2_50_49_14]